MVYLVSFDSPYSFLDSIFDYHFVNVVWRFISRNSSNFDFGLQNLRKSTREIIVYQLNWFSDVFIEPFDVSCNHSSFSTFYTIFNWHCSFSIPLAKCENKKEDKSTKNNNLREHENIWRQRWQWWQWQQQR